MQQDSLNNKKVSCRHFTHCGGCAYMGKTYGETLTIKQDTVRKLLKGLPVSVLPIIPSPDSCYYRNKVHAAFGYNRGKVICGMYETSSHRICENEGCYLENQKAASIINTIKNLAQSFKLSIYDERRGIGVLRRVLVRTADETGQILVVIVIGDRNFPGKKNFIKALLDKHPEITSIVVNINIRKDSMILGNKSEVVYGRGYITDVLCGLKFRISPESFYQINRKQTEQLYSKAIELAELSPKDKVIDAYCGIGTIGMACSSACGSVTGVELNPHAVKDAINNAKANAVKNVRFVCGDAGEFMVQEASSGNKYDVVILDPPRAGTTPEFIKACQTLSPEKIVYVSCNPETLARDIPVFMKHGYIPNSAVPVDMFPWTDSIETICVLTRKGKTNG
ncbi:MAG: 23S rRNA (uracil(1939)-C(5))-methyltransferase RlmD [Saccharofermentans sp.]|nr:23S rRNA (uracil(1939)-C(5))-methyltransferase RlmD [Saccharofermentans sp.]